MQLLNTIDLFAGCGGLTDGFKHTKKYTTLAVVEWEKSPCETIKKRLNTKWGYNNTDEIVVRFDIQRTSELLNWWDDNIYWNSKWLNNIIGNNKVDVIIWWPPCQAYSLAWRIRDDNNMKDDYRNFLFKNYLEIVNHFQPKVFVFENVPGIFSAAPNGTLIIDQIIIDFKKIGYEIYHNIKKEWIVNASNFGVPQNRNRVMILGVNKALLKWNTQTALEDFYQNILSSYKTSKLYTVRDAIYNLPKFYPILQDSQTKKSHIWDNLNDKILNHTPRFHSVRDIEIFKELAYDVNHGKVKYKSSSDLIELYFQKTGKKTNVHKYHVLERDLPSNTIPAHLYKDGLRHIHPDAEQARSITVREAARLQSFDDDFEFLGSVGDQYKMIGNAVPPQLGKAVGFAVNDFINKYF